LLLKRKLDDADVILKVEDMCLRVWCDYSFNKLGDDHLASRTQVLLMVGRFPYDGFVQGFILLSVDPFEASYERIGIATNIKFPGEFLKDKLQKTWNVRRITFV